MASTALSPGGDEMLYGLAEIVLLTTLIGTGGAQQPCLARFAGQANRASLQFDLEHDRNREGGSFSCDVFVRASKARSVLEDFRYGFLYDSRPHLERSIRFPLKVTVVDAQGAEQVLTITDVGKWLKFKAEHFDPYERALIACATLANVHIYKKWSGFAIGLGRVWFFNYLDGGLRVGQINVEPLSPELFRKSCVGEN
jgi:hypothetical protein